MKAAVLYGKEDVRVEEVKVPRLQPGEVRIAIEATLTCGTDLKVFKRGYHAKMIVPPAVFGHEMAGVIAEVQSPMSKAKSGRRRASSNLRRQGDHVASQMADGEGQGQWQVGDRVVVANSAPCGECYFCRQGQENLCDDLLFLNGAYAESIVVPARLVEKNLLRLKPSTSFRDAALAEPLACVIQGVEDARLKPQQRVLVIGAGPIGLMFVAVAKNLGCEVIVAGRGEGRLKLARKLGASKIIDVAGRSLLASVRSQMGTAPDVVIEAVGKAETWEAALGLVRKGGIVNFFGGCPAGQTIRLDTAQMHYSSLILVASFHHTPRTIRRALELIERGVIRADDFVDGQCALSQLPELFRSMAVGNRAVKTFIRVSE